MYIKYGAKMSLVIDSHIFAMKLAEMWREFTILYTSVKASFAELTGYQTGYRHTYPRL
jgi:hypothetical protein